MAKVDEFSFYEKHIEKLVLLAGLILLGLAVNYWVLSSPLTFQLIGPTGTGKTVVGPEKADQVLHQAALAIRARTAHYPPNVGPLPKYAGETTKLRLIEPAEANAVALTLPGRAIRLESTSDQDKGPTLEAVTKAIVAMPELTVTATEVVPEKEPAADAIVASGELTFPRARQLQEWASVLPKDRFQPSLIVHEVIVRVQEMLPNGQWSEPRKVTPAMRPAKPASAGAAAPAAPETQEIPAYNGNNQKEVQAAVLALAEPERQRRITQGEYYRVWTLESGWQDLRAGSELKAAPADDLKIVFHDDSTMKPGKSYRYSVQLELVNPLLGRKDELAAKSAGDAKVKYILTKFSEWSAPVAVSRQTNFFVTSESRTTQQVKATVYARVLNQVVAHEFQLAVGDPIGSVVSKPVFDPVAKAQRSIPVDFRTNCTALEFRFEAQAVKGAVFRNNAFMLVYLDPQGEVRTRFLAWDQESDRHKALKEAAERAKAARG